MLEPLEKFKHEKSDPKWIVRREIFNSLTKLNGFGYKFRAFKPFRPNVSLSYYVEIGELPELG